MKKILLLVSLFSQLCSGPIEDLKAEVLDGVQDAYGWCTQEKANRFIDLVLEVKPQLCVEIGVFGGASLLPTACALQFLGQGVVIAIDPWDKIECIRYLDPDRDKVNLKWWAHINMDHIYFMFSKLIHQFELEKTCIALRATSKKAAPLIGIIDILHIDGNHEPRVAEQDVQLYLPKVRHGGYIWFNDALWPSLQGAVDLLSRFCDIVDSVDNGNCILFKKR